MRLPNIRASLSMKTVRMRVISEVARNPTRRPRTPVPTSQIFSKRMFWRFVRLLFTASAIFSFASFTPFSVRVWARDSDPSRMCAANSAA